MLVMGGMCLLSYGITMDISLNYWYKKYDAKTHKDKAVCILCMILCTHHVYVHIPYQDTLKQHHVVNTPPGHVPLCCSQFYALPATPCILYCH